SGNDLGRLADLLLANAGQLPVVTAIDHLLYPAFMLGADGAIAPISAVVPDLCVGLWKGWQGGDHPAARSLHEGILGVWRAVNGVGFLRAARAAIELRGRRVGPPRHPHLSIAATAHPTLSEALKGAGLLEPAAKPGSGVHRAVS